MSSANLREVSGDVGDKPARPWQSKSVFIFACTAAFFAGWLGMFALNKTLYSTIPDQGRQAADAPKIADVFKKSAEAQKPVEAIPTLPKPIEPGPNLVYDTVPNPAATPTSNGGAEMSWCMLQRNEPRDICLLRIVTQHPGTKAAELSANLIREQMLRNATLRQTPRRTRRR